MPLPATVAAATLPTQASPMPRRKACISASARWKAALLLCDAAETLAIAKSATTLIA